MKVKLYQTGWASLAFPSVLVAVVSAAMPAASGERELGAVAPAHTGPAAVPADEDAVCQAPPGAMFIGFMRRLVALHGAQGPTDAGEWVVLFRAFNRMFSTRPLARAALGRHWTAASEAERARLQELFEFYLMESYLGIAVEATRSRLDQMRARPLGPDEAVVFLDQPVSAGPDLRVLEIHVRREPCGLAILDVRAAGASVVELMRAEFHSIARRAGTDGLIRRLQEHVRASPAWDLWQARASAKRGP